MFAGSFTSLSFSRCLNKAGVSWRYKSSFETNGLQWWSKIKLMFSVMAPQLLTIGLSGNL